MGDNDKVQRGRRGSSKGPGELSFLAASVVGGSEREEKDSYLRVNSRSLQYYVGLKQVKNHIVIKLSDYATKYPEIKAMKDSVNVAQDARAVMNSLQISEGNQNAGILSYKTGFLHKSLKSLVDECQNDAESMFNNMLGSVATTVPTSHF